MDSTIYFGFALTCGLLELSQGYSLLSKENMHNQAEEHLQITVITLHCSKKKKKGFTFSLIRREKTAVICI